ncbi:MAG: hypothetical protein QFX35_04450 [Candidatus Verstraetearchaeota archaeon]|nr:hypothetical protein [Candidatus Verstraetearchaeota archaeon]
MIASINVLKNLELIRDELGTTGTKVIVVDEGSQEVRSRNEKILSSLEHAFYGPEERERWFRDRFGACYQKYLQVIPKRAHAETSFGFLVAFEEGADFIVELDDDVFIMGVVQGHSENLFGEGGLTVRSKSRWYNTLDSIAINTSGRFFPRGHPYSPDTRVEDYIWEGSGGSCVLNMGHWVGNPDFDALTILYHSGMDGRCGIRGERLLREKVIVGKGTYFAVCSMNTSFIPKIVPAFYQLYMNTMGVDRFDDIWSGIFLKRVADHLGDRVCLGKPAGTHDKRPRSVFKDLRSEMDGMVLNESVWRFVDGDLSGSSYADAYLSLADLLERGASGLDNENYRKFLALQVEMMRRWVEIVDRL